SWGDGRAPDGTVGFIQPLIEPLFDGVSELELLAALAGEVDKDPWTLVHDHWRDRTGNPPDFEVKFRDWIRLGVIPGSRAQEVSVTPRWDELGRSLRAWRASRTEGLQISFAPDYSVYDGRYAHNDWLQELPDPVTKVVWDNGAYVG